MPNVVSGSLNHVSLSCRDMVKSRKFYDLLLCDFFGYKPVMDQPYCVMFAKGEGSMICISPGNNTPHHKANPGLNHLAFTVATKKEIDDVNTKIVEFYKANGEDHGHILDAPALYPQYSPSYYAVFFTDPSGIKLEVCFNEGY
ncbi:hypothetical protein BG004_004791 [Podila humilis]|nr:hypothetical protein BG004_004791 [Podila humilis]